MTHQTKAALKAHETMFHQWGADEASRAAHMAAWTGDNPGQPAECNPYRREAFYGADDQLRAAFFAEWAERYVCDARDNPFAFDADTRPAPAAPPQPRSAVREAVERMATLGIRL